MENSKQPAFPHVAFNQQGEYTTGLFANGLTKREYFAAMAMQALLTGDPAYSEEKVAEKSVSIADKLLKALDENTL